MHFCSRYWLPGACFAVFCTVIMINQFILPSLDQSREIFEQEELEKLNYLHDRSFREILNKTFFDDPRLNNKCESNRKLLLAKDSDTECLGDNTIFFLETSGSSSLKARQACAVESAAQHHPEWQVRVLSTSSNPMNLTNTYMELLTQFDNIKFLRMNLTSLMKGTPLWYWYKLGNWKSSPYKVVHLSDAIRLCVLWKYGGIYLDTDVVVLRSLSHLRNTVAFDSGTNIGNSFLSFDRGQALLRFTIADFVASYQPGGFANNGPMLLNKNFKLNCEPKYGNVNDNKCQVNILPKESMYLIDFNKWWQYFKPQTATLSETAFNNSYIIHVWNKLSSRKKMVVGQNSWYEVAMRRHCPKVYELVTSVGYA